MICDKLKDIAPYYRKISERDVIVFYHVLDNLTYKDNGYGLSKTDISMIFWKHMNRLGRCYKELDYQAQKNLCCKDFKYPKPLEFVADNRELIDKVMKEFDCYQG